VLELNRYLDRTAPWQLARRGTAADGARLGTVLYQALVVIRDIARATAPFVPGASARLLAALGGHSITAGAAIGPLPALFPRLREQTV
jgi:methionyl-tRNA synthetase